MAIVEQVIIKVDIDADITGDLASIEARIKALEKRFADLDKAGGRAAGSVDDLTDSTKKLNKENDRLGKKFQKTKIFLDAFESGIKKLGSVLFSFIKTLGKISFIALAAEVAVFSAALLGIKAALAGGRALVQGYQYAMTGLSAAAASVATGLAVAAAAMRQYQEAQLIPLMGGGVGGRAGASMINRSVTAQTRGLYGSEAMGAVISSLASAGVRRADPIASQLYNISGGDSKAAQALALQFASAKQSGNTSELIASLQQTRGFNAESIKSGASLESIIATISSGAGTAEAYQNVAEDMAGTFIGSIKTEFESIKAMFADAGTNLLGPFQDSFMQISRIIKDDLLGIFQVVREFGSGSLAPSLVSFADAVSEFVRSNIVKYVSDIAGTADKLSGFFGKMGSWYERTKDWFKSYEAAANVVWEMVKAIFSSSEGGLFRSFSDLLVENKDAFIDFGSKIGDVITAIKQAFMTGNQGFFGALDRLGETLTVVAESVIPAVANVMGAIAPMLDKIPEILRMVSDRLGPVLVNIAEAFQPVIDKLPNVVDGVLRIVEGLEPLIVGLAKVVDLILDVLSLGGGAGNIAAAAGSAYLLGGGLKATGGGKGGLLSKGLMAFYGGANMVGGKGRSSRGLGINMSGFGATAEMASRSGAAAKAGRFAKLRAGARGGPMLGIGGAMMGVGGVSQVYDEGASFGGVASGVGGGAMLGMSVAGPVGAAVGAVVGGIAVGIAAWARDNRIEEASRELASDFMSGVKSVFEGGEIAGGFTDEERATFENLSELGKKAEHASVYDKNAGFSVLENMLNLPGGANFEAIRASAESTGLISSMDLRRMSDERLADYIGDKAAEKVIDGDNEAMKEFIQAGLDSGFLAQYDSKYANMTLEDFDLDEFAKEIDDVNAAFERFLADDEIRRNKLDTAISGVADSLNVSADVIKDFMDEMGMVVNHAEDLNQLALKNLYALYNSPVIDLAQGFSADLANTARNREEVLTSADAAYNTLIQEAGSEEGLSTATMQDYLSKYSSAAVALGGNAATAELGAITNLQRGIRMGEVSPDILEGFDLDELSEGILRDMAEEYAVSFEELSSAFSAPGGGVGGVERFLKEQSEDREVARDIFFGSGDVLAGRSQADINSLLENDAFTRFATDAVTRLGGTAAEDFAALGGDSQARLDYLNEQGLIRGVLQTMATSGEEVFGINLSDLGDPVAQQMAAVAEAIRTQQPPQTNINIKGEAQDRAGGQVALVSVSWSSTQATMQQNNINAQRSGENPNG